MTIDIQTYLATALQNDFFAGGLALGLFGVAAGLLRLWGGSLKRLITRRFSVTVSVDNRSQSFRYLLLWLEKSGAQKRVRRFRLTYTGGRGGCCDSLTPAPGQHWFIHKGQFAWLGRHLSEKARTQTDHRTEPLETLTLTLPFGRIETVEGWIAEGAAMIARQRQIGPALHLYGDGYWEQHGHVLRRSASTLVSDDNRIGDLIEDVRWFYGAKDWYVARGVPWRRGYLLHGPPGTGKSSVIRTVASELNLGLAILDVGRRMMGDDQLCEAVVSAPPSAVLVIEDIDAVFTERQSGAVKSGISFSGLLNALDGVAAQEGRALFMTTNHIERLDPALIRPGRADRHVKLGHVGAGAARAQFLRFFPGEEALADRFCDQLGKDRFAPAALQGWLLQHANDADAAAGADDLITPARHLAAE